MSSSNKSRYLTAINCLRKEYLSLNQKIPDTIDALPLLREFVDLFKKLQPLRNCTALLIQHQCADHYAQALALIELGIQPEKLFWIDIPYSSHKEVRRRLHKIGIQKSNFYTSDGYRILRPFAPYMRSRVEKVVRFLLAHSPREKLLVLDDGSYFLEALSGFKNSKNRFRNAVVVEQTTRGIIKIDQNATLNSLSKKVRVINVARSWPKKNLEPPFIGLAICTALQKKMGLYFKNGIGGNCLVLGYGAIGEQVAEFLYRCQKIKKKRIYIYDTDKKKIRRAKSAGFSLWSRDNNSLKFEFIIGCSGTSSFSVGDRIYLADNAVLASASSGSVELSREEFIELADTSKVDDVWIRRNGLIQTNSHSDIGFNITGYEATFLNCGFPLNFDGRVTTIPRRHIQITPTLMVAGAIQGILSNKTGMIELCPFFSAWVYTRYRDLLGKESILLKKRYTLTK